MKKQKLVTIGLVVILLSFWIGVQQGFSWEGAISSWTPGYFEEARINATTEFYRAGDNYTAWIDSTYLLDDGSETLDISGTFSATNINATTEFYRAGANYTAWVESQTLYQETQPYDYLIYNDTTNAVVVAFNNSIVNTDSNFIDALDFALSSLTSGRNWVEKIVIRGYFTVTKQCNVADDDYTYIDATAGTFYTASGTNTEIIRAASSLTEFHWRGGLMRGNLAGNPTIDKSWFFLEHMTFSSITGATGYDVNGHFVRMGNTCEYNLIDVTGDNIWDCVVALSWCNYNEVHARGFNTNEDAIVWVLGSSYGNHGTVTSQNATSTALKLDGASSVNSVKGENWDVQVDGTGGSQYAIMADSFVYDSTITFAITGDTAANIVGLWTHADSSNNHFSGVITGCNKGVINNGDLSTFHVTVNNCTDDGFDNRGYGNNIQVTASFNDDDAFTNSGSYNIIILVASHHNGVGDNGYIRTAGGNNTIIYRGYDNTSDVTKDASDTEY